MSKDCPFKIGDRVQFDTADGSGVDLSEVGYKSGDWGVITDVWTGYQSPPIRGKEWCGRFSFDTGPYSKHNGIGLFELNIRTKPLSPFEQDLRAYIDEEMKALRA